MSRKLWDELRAAAVDTGAVVVVAYLVAIVVVFALFLISGIP